MKTLHTARGVIIIGTAFYKLIDEQLNGSIITLAGFLKIFQENGMKRIQTGAQLFY